VTLDIQQNEFVALMGASGSGKSTLMNVLGCLDRATRGRYLLDGVDVSGLDKNELADIRNQSWGLFFRIQPPRADHRVGECRAALPLREKTPLLAKNARARHALPRNRRSLQSRGPHAQPALGGQQQRVRTTIVSLTLTTTPRWLSSGAKNSAAIAALEVWRHGGRVTLVHRGPAMHAHVKYWIKPDIENRIKNGEIKAYFNSTVKEITADSVLIATPVGEQRLPNDFVLALTGYHPDFEFMKGLGIRSTADRLPVVNPKPWKAMCPESTWLASSSPAEEPTRSSSRMAASTGLRSPAISSGSCSLAVRRESGRARRAIPANSWRDFSPTRASLASGPDLPSNLTVPHICCS